MSEFVGGVLNSQEVTHEKALVGCAGEAETFVRTMSGLVGGFLQDGKTIFAYANNHYQNHSPSTLARFLELRRGEA